MPKRNRHREEVKRGKMSTDWTRMLVVSGERARLMRDNPRVVIVLDYLAGQREPYREQGWTAFNDWLDAAYDKYFAKRPDGIPFVTIDELRVAVFPACAGATAPFLIAR